MVRPCDGRPERVNSRTHHRRRPSSIRVWTELRVIPTYLPAPPDKNPMFLERRVYQGSSGRVYPLPFTDRIAEKPVDRRWQTVWLENRFLRVMILPELGGRIHAIQDKTNACDLVYNQPVIKPALVGLAGPWISGGIEFNWPQHHRPATFLPVDFEIEKHADGSATAWCSDHDPIGRMKGMHGVCLHPDRAVVELKVRLYNRTPFTQTFLWWANVATRVHEAYQSFFPPDVQSVADHARRSMSEYPLARGLYYGVNYGERGRKGIPGNEVPSQFIPAHCGSGSEPSTLNYQPNDLSFYANIPVPTSYMCTGSRQDFFGGYDHRAQSGIVHIASHHISPGKKQWTWGNHDFGYAWDRNLTDADATGEFAPYIELMAGVYTDNQPDFSFLQPGETKSWSQYWYPIQRIGPAQHANLNAAVSLTLRPKDVSVGVAVTRAFPNVVVRLERADGSAAAEWDASLAPGKPLVRRSPQPRKPWTIGEAVLRVLDQQGRVIISFQPKPPAKSELPPPATEPPEPADIANADELFITGLHLDQYRHATRCPTPYWREALRRDPLDARCNNALGRWHLQRGEFTTAEKHFRSAIQRLTSRNANPYDGEAFYSLGLCLRHLDRDHEAYEAFYKACWNQAWMAAGYHAIAEIDCCRKDWATALDHLDRSLRLNTDNLRARNLKVIVLRKLKQEKEARRLLGETLVLDPLDWWARFLKGDPLSCDAQVALDLMHDFSWAGLFSEAAAVFAAKAKRRRQDGVTGASGEQLPNQSWGASPLLHYTMGWVLEKTGHRDRARKDCLTASGLPSDYCFPARLEDIRVLKAAMELVPNDPKSPYYLGNLLYNRRRHEEAIELWEQSARLDPHFSIVWRNLGIGYYNVRKQPTKARRAYDNAIAANPDDARLLYERDQLWKRLGKPPAKRLRELEKHLDLVQQRDDLSVELCALYNQIGAHDKALALVGSRNFQPWEGGEGDPLGQWARSHLMLGRAAFKRGNATAAQEHFAAALTAPPNLGEARHLLANQSDAHFWLGCAHAELGESKQAKQHWQAAARFKGDFQFMSVRAFSEMTYYSALSWKKLGQGARARTLLQRLLNHARQLRRSPATIDYFATSLPTMLLFNDDLQRRQEITALLLEAQAWLGLGRRARAATLLRAVLKRDPNHPHASDLIAELEA